MTVRKKCGECHQQWELINVTSITYLEKRRERSEGYVRYLATNKSREGHRDNEVRVERETQN